MSVYVGESRGELLQWINDLLHPTTITKVEQCGTGAVYCQIMDSIFGNIPVNRVRFNAKQEYEYLENFKILQKCFNQNKIDKPIPVDKLIKCKMQDNLEFLQWMKKYWDAHNPGAGYDAGARSGGQGVVSAPSTSRAPSGTSARGTTRTPLGGAGGAPRAVSAASSAQLQQLTAQVAEMQAMCESVEKERDFYFDKLRNVEVIVQGRLATEDLPDSERDVLAKIQEILYSTTEGFEMPENGEMLDEGEPQDELVEGEEETF